MLKRAHEEALSSGESTQSVASEALAHVPSVVKADMPRTSSILRTVRRARQANLGVNSSVHLSRQLRYTNINFNKLFN